MHTYIYIYVYMDIYIYIYTHVFIDMCIYILCAYIDAYIHQRQSLAVSQVLTCSELRGRWRWFAEAGSGVLMSLGPSVPAGASLQGNQLAGIGGTRDTGGLPNAP